MLEIRDLHVRFHNRDREAVSGVSLTIRDGEILGLVGESGSGKSVTAMSVAGLLPRKQCDYSGEILLDGQELLHADRAALRKIQGADIGVVFQEPQSCMDPLMRIGAQVEEALRLHTRLSRAECREAALAAMRAAELPDPEGVYEKYPHQLSGGMLQRAMIAAAIVNRPKLLLLDEPTTALDVTIQAQIMALLRNLQKESGMSMILITHDIGLVASMADRVIVMYAGQIIEEAPVKELFAAPAHPYTKALLQTVPGIYDEKDRELVAIPGMVPENYDSIPGCRFADRCAFRTKGCDQPQSYRQIGEGHFVRCMLAKEGET